MPPSSSWFEVAGTCVGAWSTLATRAPRASAKSVTTRPSAPSAPVTTMTFPSMMGLRIPVKKTAHTIVRRISFAMRRISHLIAGIQQNIRAEDDEMDDVVSCPCDTHPGLVIFSYPLPHLKAALQGRQKIRIVAIGSSSTAGVAPVLPYPPRLEMLLREKYHGLMIDVINRGISGQEASDELLRFQSDVFDEKPALVIWQIGTNAQQFV